MKKQIVLYSHGFAVDKTDRGLFTDISQAMPEAENVMFCYDEKDKQGNTIAADFTTREKKLTDVYRKLRKQNPDAAIDLVCHSQGCLVATLANLPNLRKIIFLAPPLNYKNGETEAKRKLQLDAVTAKQNGDFVWQRRDGSVTIIKPEFWKDYEKLSEIKSLINNLNNHNDLYVIKATKDEVLVDNSYDGLDGTVKVIELDAGHNFESESRKRVVDIVHDLLLEAK